MQPSAHADPAATDLLLVNPAAGGGRASEILPEVREFARKSGWQVEICVTQSADDLAAQARKAAQAGRKRILVLGGDGTFQVLVNALIAFPGVVLGIIPAGGGNDLAAALGLPADPLQAAALLLRGETCSVDAVRVRTSEGKERFYMGGGGLGLDAEAARYASGVYRNLRGRLRYVLAAIRALFGFHAIRVRIRMEGCDARNFDATALLVGVLNTPSYGAGLCLAPQAKTDDGKLDLVLLDDLKAGEILTLLPALLSRGELRTKRVKRFRVERVWVEADRPCWFHGDGELMGTTPVEVSVVPRAVRILAPARKAEDESVATTSERPSRI